MSDVCTDYCLRCVYYEKHLKNCAFLELTGKIRGCDPGDGCTARILKRGGHRRKGDACWDVGLAQDLYNQGLPFKAIAEQVHVHPTAVGNYARKHGWVRTLRKKESHEEQEETLREPQGVSEEARPESCDVADHERNPAAPDPEAPDHRGSKGGGEMSRQEAVAAAVEGLSGMNAFLTGVAVSNLIGWQSREDLEEAKAAIELLISRTAE